MSAADRIDTAEIIAVGSELLTPYRTDTNSLFITARLNESGVDVRGKCVVGDDRVELRGAFERARARARLVVLTGGLGPTDDDVTREVVAAALGRPLVEDAGLVERMQQRFAARGLRMPDVNRRQAMVPTGAVVLANARGTAPGLWLEDEGGGVLLLPGPPREMQPMLERFVAETLAPRTAGARLYRRVLRIAGWTESHVEEVAQPVYGRWRDLTPPVSTTILAAPGQIELHLSVRSDDEAGAARALSAATDEIAGVLQPGLFSTDGRSLEEVIGAELTERRLTIAVGESCTGGLVASRLTDVPGSSTYLLVGVVAYSNRSKTELLDVPGELIASHGAVSEPVAVAMAEGARARAGADLGVGVTGIAGPTGATPGKPVGTVVIAVVGPEGAARVRRLQFPGERAIVKQQAAQAALEQVRRLVLRVE